MVCSRGTHWEHLELTLSVFLAERILCKLAAKTKSQRQKDRRALGSLQDNVVSPVTRKRYEKAVHSMFSWMQSESIHMPTNVSEFDDDLCRYIEHCGKMEKAARPPQIQRQDCNSFDHPSANN